jgi:asparagine synthase (glutamine-hydrolysing)
VFSGCGIAGVLHLPGHPDQVPGADDVVAMTRALAHRGPNGEGFHHGDRVFLGHRRLRILDLTDAGAQPMTRSHLTIVYNGELYNVADLRSHLAHHYRFQSRTDTEVVLRAWQHWGPDALDRFDGMYAFAVWNARTRQLHLVRDRLGIKPLYLYHGTGFVAFASEVDALLHCRQIPAEPDLDTLTRLLLCSTALQIDRTATAVAGISHIPPATHVRVDADGHRTDRLYWQLPTAVDHHTPAADLAVALRDRLTASVTAMRVADVPVAALLSGGLDSTAITALAATSGPQVTAFTIAYTDPATGRIHPEGNDDLHHSRTLAAALADRIDHRVLRVPSTLTIDDLDAVTDLALPGDDVRHVAMLAGYKAVATAGIPVVLNGQGADELMAGYIARPNFTAVFGDVRRPGTAPAAQLPGPWELPYLSRQVLTRRAEVHAALRAFHAALPGPALDRAQRLLMHAQLGRVLQFEDRLSMRAGVECRLPFLNHHLVEQCFTTPFHRHIHPAARHGKVLLRDALLGLVPATLLARPKQIYPSPNATALHRSLAALAAGHEPQLRADPLIGHLFALPPKGAMPSLNARALWMLLSTWRWHTRLRNPTAVPARPEPVR